MSSTIYVPYKHVVCCLCTISKMSSTNYVPYQKCRLLSMHHIKNVVYYLCTISKMSSTIYVPYQKCLLLSMYHTKNVVCYLCTISKMSSTIYVPYRKCRLLSMYHIKHVICNLYYRMDMLYVYNFKHVIKCPSHAMLLHIKRRQCEQCSFVLSCDVSDGPDIADRISTELHRGHVAEVIEVI